MRFEMVVVGASTGGIGALTTILSMLSPDFPLPIVIVQHVGRTGARQLARVLARASLLDVRVAGDKEIPRAGRVYIAPAGYHLLVEPDRSLSLDASEPLQFSRPSVDALFESAAAALGSRAIGVVVTGANCDGAAGIAAICRRGGVAIVQDPTTARAPEMPKAAIAAAAVDHVVSLDALGPLLNELVLE